mgnify:FL=1
MLNLKDKLKHHYQNLSIEPEKNTQLGSKEDEMRERI